jgi:hypothetical protein
LLRIGAIVPSIFHRYAAAGFLPYILPILPVDAAIKPSIKDLKAGRGDRPALAEKRGKTPGKFLPHLNKWVGMVDWQVGETTAAQIDEWATWPGAGLGLRCGKLIAVDVDVTVKDLARQLHRVLTERLGPAPLRVGNPPKFLLLYRLDDKAAGVGKIRLPFELDGVQAVEILGEGRQFVSEGLHPKTLKPYQWIGRHPCDVGLEGLL